MNPRNAIELFCGVGGTSFGFLEAGFDVKLGLDIDPIALETFSLNHPHAVAVCDDIQNVSGADLIRTAEIDELDVLIGGPSCQGYSTIGKRISDDPRNSQFKHYMRLVKETEPKWIVFENVRGMLISAGGQFFDELATELLSLGYRVSAAIVNAADYGVPQRRERVILLGTRLDIDVSLPRPTHMDPRCRICAKPDSSNRIRSKVATDDCARCDGRGREPTSSSLDQWLSLHDAISDLPFLEDLKGSDRFVEYECPAKSDYQEFMRIGTNGYNLHKARPLSEYALSIVRNIAPGNGIRSIPESELPDRFKAMRKVSNGKLRRDCTTLYYRLAWDLPSYTVTCYSNNVSSGAFTHPVANRAITVREAARLQSFPDRFTFVNRQVRRQIGNAVPPMLAKRIATHIVDMEENRNIDDVVHHVERSIAVQARLL